LSQRVSVIGEVNQPGRYPIESNSTVFDVIALAGGVTKFGADIVYIFRPVVSGELQRIDVDLRRIVASRAGTSLPIQTVRGGDQIVVPKWTFTVTGEVNNPGEYRIEGDMTLYQAVARAGGTKALGSNSPSRWVIRRLGPDGKKFIEIKGKKDMRVQPDDVITVKERLF
jgi:polysaccharide export outer membrane protein